MRILVFSDSHRVIQPMLDAVSKYNPDAVFHLGDVMPDADMISIAFPSLKLYKVAGNCDYFLQNSPLEQLAYLEGKTILYLHGHTQSVKLGLDSAVHKAESVQANILLFGHTHVRQKKQFGELLAVNPGAAANGAAALLTWTDGGEVTCEHISI